MSSGIRRTWRGALATAILLMTSDLASRLAYSDAAVAAQVDVAVRRTFENLAGRDEPEAGRGQPRLRVTAFP